MPVGDRSSIFQVRTNINISDFSFPAVIVRWDFLAFTVSKTSMSAHQTLASMAALVKTLWTSKYEQNSFLLYFCTLAFIHCVLYQKWHISVKARRGWFPEFVLKGERTKPFSKENPQGCGVPLQSVPVYITSLSSSLTHISCYSKDREQIQQEHIMYLDWAWLHWCFSLLCLMGAPGLLGLVGQMGREVPGPIWVLNGLSPVCLPSWFRSHVTWPCSQRSPDCTVQGVHIRCALTSLPTTSNICAAISISLTQQAEQVHLYCGDESDSILTEPLLPYTHPSFHSSNL